jgi:iron complex transport system substrate-binding protein
MAGPKVLGVTDDLGSEIVLEAPAGRVVALYPAFEEMLLSMGLEERIVGRASSGVSDAMPVGTHMRPSVELVLSLKPDLVVQLGGRAGALPPLDRLRALGTPVAVFNPKDVAGIFGVIERLGVLLGEEARAGALVAKMRQRLEAVAEQISGDATRPRVVFEVRYPNLLAAGQGSVVHDVIRLAGGQNAVEVDKRFARLSEEALLALDPDVYIVQQGPMNPEPGSVGDRPHFRALKAVQEGRVLVVDEGLFSRPGPRVVEAVEQLAEYFGRDGREASEGVRP